MQRIPNRTQINYSTECVNSRKFFLLVGTLELSACFEPLTRLDQLPVFIRIIM